MSEVINWDEVEKETGGKYKNYAPEGRHNVVLNDVEVHEVGSKGNYAVDLKFEETDDTQYQKATYWISKDKRNWRIKSMKDLLTVLSGSEENAKKVCEMAESKGSFDYAVAGYEKALKTLAAKKIKTEIEVYFSGMYSQKGTPINNATLTDPRVYNKNVKKEDTNPLAGATDVDLSEEDEMGQLPF